MRLEDGIVYWERRGRHKCGNRTDCQFDCRSECDSLYFGFATRS